MEDPKVIPEQTEDIYNICSSSDQDRVQFKRNLE